MRIAITGAAGFIGTNLVNYLGTKAVLGITGIDKLGYGSGDKPKIPFLYTSLQNLREFPRVFEGIDAVVNLAAETHVDRSLANLSAFYESNVHGTVSLLDAISKSRNRKLVLVHISTDEVFGPSNNGKGFSEHDPLDPHNPYGGTKAAAEMLVTAWAHETHQPTVICRLSNVFGPYQYPEKLIPKAVINTILDKTVPVYGSGKQSREWTFVGDACSAIEKSLEFAVNGFDFEDGGFPVFNFSSGQTLSTLEVLKILEDSIGPLKVEHVKDRPGHDFQYRMDSSAARTVLGWQPESRIRTRICETARWFKENRAWWEAILQRNPKLLSSQPWFEKWD